MTNNSFKKKQIKQNKKTKKNNICKTVTPTHNTFEDKIEEVFKQSNIDFISTNYNLEKQILSDFKKAVSPSNVTPENDFYSYINDRWLQDYELEEGQEYIVQVDDFRIVQDKVFRELIEIIEDYLKTPDKKNMKKYNSLKNAYNSFKFDNYNTDKQSRLMAKQIVNYIDDLRKDKQNLWKLLAFYNNNEIISWGCPFVWSLNPDDKNPKVYNCYLESPNLSLIDLNLYFDDNTNVEFKKKYRNKYFAYLNTLFTDTFGKDHHYNVKNIYECEIKILTAMGCDFIKESDQDKDNYNLVSKDEALKDFNFNWKEFCLELGFDKVPKQFVTSNINYLLCGTKMMLDEWDTPEWRTYWVYLYIRQQQRWNKKGAITNFDFFGKYVRGQEALIGKNIIPIFSMGFCYNNFLSNEYVTKYNNPEKINYVQTMAQDLKTVFTRIIKRNNWLQPKTKEKALQKLYNFNLTIGSQLIKEEDPILDYVADDAWGNIVKMANWRHQRAVKLFGNPVVDIPVIDWTQTPPKFIGTQSFVVNASYTPSENRIYIPLGYIQQPFVDLEDRGIEYNLSRVGFTIAHEMSHALDDWGSKYDEFGRLNNWWTEKDMEKFRKIQKDVIKQYEVFASYDGIKFDAEPSIGEDLADISGLTICREYLRDFQLKNKDILPIQRLSFEAFFIYFAVQQRQKISKKALLAQLITNPHPLDKYRTNVPLSRLPVFRSMFNVKKGDKMWWHSTNRVWEN
jgi:predicted metalloendopeptidase